MSTLVRNLGSSATLLPQVKRSICAMPNGRALAVVPDTNLATSSGDDVTGVPKLFLYVSDGSARTSWTLKATESFASNAPMSSTRAFLGSFATVSNGSVYAAYQRGDGALEFRLFPWNSGTNTFDASSAQTVVAAGADASRYRAIDIAVTGTGNPAIIVYERAASNNQGAWIRVYIRLNDGTTWRKAYETQIMTTQFVRTGSEDVSISWGASGIVSNVGRLAMYWTNTRTTDDQGDVLREISFNVATGTDGSATVVRTWLSTFNKNTAAGSRRGWIFRNRHQNVSDDIWVFGGIVGMASPYYVGIRLKHTTSTLSVNKSTNVPSEVVARRYGTTVTTGRSAWAMQSCSYEDNRLLFMFVGSGIGSLGAILRGVLFRWSDDDLTNDVVSSIDQNSRILDDSVHGLPLAVYCGVNRSVNNLGELQQLTLLAVYGDTGSTVSTSLARKATVGVEHPFSAPLIVQPNSVNVSKNLPTFQVLATADELYANNRGRLRIQVSQDPAFLSGVTTITEQATSYKSFQSPDGINRVSQFMSIVPSSSEELFSGTWHWRARVQGDLGTLSDWSTGTFTISHPPAAMMTFPPDDTTLKYEEGDVTFAWSFSDNEPTDTQTAYQLVIRRLDTNAIVQDTGKVASSSNGTSLAISAALRDIPLSASVTLWDTDDTAGAASAPTRFMVTDPPIVLITAPTGNLTITTGLLTVQWSYQGAPQVQTHYRVVVWDMDESPSVVVADTGWIVGQDTDYTFPTQVITAGVNYRVLVYVKDSYDMISHAESNLLGNSSFERSASGWTPSNCTVLRTDDLSHEGSYSLEVTPGGACSVETVTYPVTVDHEYYSYAWVYSELGWADVEIIIDWRDNLDASIATSVESVTVPAAEWVPLQITATAPLGAVGARVRIAMTNVPTSSDKIWIDEVFLKHSPVMFDASWAIPAAGAPMLSYDEFKVTIAWDDSTIDTDFVSWRVYRRYNKAASDILDIDNTRNTWELIFETAEVLSSYEYRDYFAPMNKEVEYIVVQMVDRDGSLIESNLPSPASVTIPGNKYYFVPEVPIGNIASFEPSGVNADSFTREIEQATLRVVGRGRQVQIGDDLGYAGQLTLRLRDPATARQDREFIELLCRSGSGAAYIRSPFGDVIYVNFGSPSFNRMAGVGNSDLGDLSIPYTEVYREDLPKRTV